ncbi:cytochrome c oxidase accessory protein CcoG [Lutibacter sp. TH_r2]|uniref:cytochrome c oxidase accessory protein CcoG n=1 Tax=Lutibacter sp. TH_r2 TaxID=3082083 RepID=UPI002953C5D3|nr:cytochrome c oxidase accessory protein CcoG [Lutibacter sp. TH_r2]MDV7188413.1 cytochrome c oxidase accessory protein CcoG [Lutibacter sp. TH_r2]
MQKNEKFRDSIGTIDESGKRNFIHPKKPKGKFYKYRTYVSWVLITFLFVAPFIKIKGNQFLLFNVLERKFHIFGFPFWPQDFHLLVISILLSVVFVILFTVVFGRIFCGWMCPQTIFMEMIFRKVEYLIEGDRSKQIKLDKQPWNAEKIRKKVLKWFVFFLISFLIANVFLAYLIGGDEVLQYAIEGPMAHVGTLIKLLIFTTVFYFVFAWFREQVCIIVCPYGRLQGVLLDNKSINVAYDFVRGENEAGRKKIKKDEDRDALGHGDCIDCKQCVQVCPTGIDIRNGTQLECINCTACIDACDAIMEKTGFEKGLIRYASEDNIEKKEKFKFTARLIAYSGILTILAVVLVTMLFLRNDVEATILRLPGQTFQSTPTTIKNIYTFKLINKTTEEIKNVELKLTSHKGKVVLVGGELTVPKQGLKEGTIFVEIDRKDLNSSKEELEFGVYSGGKLIETTSTNFMGPLKIK